MLLLFSGRFLRRRFDHERETAPFTDRPVSETCWKKVVQARDGPSFYKSFVFGVFCAAVSQSPHTIATQFEGKGERVGVFCSGGKKAHIGNVQHDNTLCMKPVLRARICARSELGVSSLGNAWLGLRNCIYFCKSGRSGGLCAPDRDRIELVEAM